MSEFLRKFVAGENVNPFGLHFIATPDTVNLMDSVRKKVQAMLDSAHNSNPGLNRKQEITYDIIPGYEQFACGETIVYLSKSVRGKHAYLFSDPSGDFQDPGLLDSLRDSNLTPKELQRNVSKHYRSLNDKLIHDKLALSSIDVHGARTTNLVMGCIPYARQDKDTPKRRESASLDQLAKELSAITGEQGYIFTVDLHNPASKASFKGTNLVNLHTGWFIEKCIEDMGGEIVLSPTDQGGSGKVRAMSKDLESQNIEVIKTRDYSKPNSVEETEIYGDVSGRDILIYDDMLDTGGTMCKLLEKILEKKPKSISIAITHGMFNGEAYSKLEKVIKESKGVIKKIYMTNSINKIGLPGFVQRIGLYDILANNILAVYKGLSLDKNGGSPII